jgi:hypothetical protein
MAKARRALGIKGFAPMRKSGRAGVVLERLYKETMRMYRAAK